MNFQPGFRFSLRDFFVLIVAGGLVWLVYPLDSILGFAIAFVVLHFFLFCNVFRMARLPELIWAANFVLLALASLKFDMLLTARDVAIICAALTCVLVFLEMRKPSYHGICWQKINPNLESWFAQQNSA